MGNKFFIPRGNFLNSILLISKLRKKCFLFPSNMFFEKKLSHSMEKKIGKLQREREELKGNVKELTTEMETQ